MELGSLVQLAVNLDLSLHGVHNVLGDGHAQAAALDPVNPLVVLSGKGFKNPFLELRRHADAVVLHQEVGAHKFLSLWGILLIQGHGNLTAVRGEF